MAHLPKSGPRDGNDRSIEMADSQAYLILVYSTPKIRNTRSGKQKSCELENIEDIFKCYDIVADSINQDKNKCGWNAKVTSSVTLLSDSMFRVILKTNSTKIRTKF